MKIITMATLKGGSGKTMNAFNIGGMLAEKNKVLLIDVDPQCNLSNNCGVDVSDPNLMTIKEVFANQPGEQPSPEEIIYKRPIKKLPKLDIIPSSIMIFDTEEKMINATNRESYLRYYIRNDYKDVFDYYDYIIIDTNPSMSIINVNAFYAADSIILSSDVSTNSINGAELFCDLWENKRKLLRIDDNIAALIICNLDKRTNLGKSLVDYTAGEAFSRDITLKTVIPATVKLKNTEIEHMTVNLLYPDSEVRKAYKGVIKELKQRGVL